MIFGMIGILFLFVIVGYSIYGLNMYCRSIEQGSRDSIVDESMGICLSPKSEKDATIKIDGVYDKDNIIYLQYYNQHKSLKSTYFIDMAEDRQACHIKKAFQLFSISNFSYGPDASAHKFWGVDTLGIKNSDKELEDAYV